MGPENGVNLERVSYFPLKDYISKIKLSEDVLFHVEETSTEFDKYINKLIQFDDKTIFYFLLSSFDGEIRDTNLIENHLISPLEIKKENIFFDSLNISHKRIKDLHRFVSGESEEYDYRKVDAWVRRKNKDNETIYWYGVNPEDIHRFVDDFIEIYKGKSVSAINNNAFIKSVLVHLLIMRIHPFKDGNGRTSRMIQNMKFTDSINKVYDYNLKISPLHLSKSILLNKQTYFKIINSIYFDLQHDCNSEINKYFDFMLYMFDEQIFYMSNHLKKIEDTLLKLESTFNANKLEEIASNMRLVKRR